MSRFTMPLAAAVATAMLVIGVSALDAVGADPPAKAADDLTGKLTDCLRDRGVAVPAGTATQLDRWLRTHRIPDADGRACKEAVAPPEAKVREAPSAGVKQLSECLRARGFDVPTDPIALKQWIGEQRARAALGALKECGIVPKPDAGEKPAPCGVAPAEKPDAGASRQRRQAPEDTI
jgi:hypothetical protein